jgi:hypothetical protein
MPVTARTKGLLLLANEVAHNQLLQLRSYSFPSAPTTRDPIAPLSLSHQYLQPWPRSQVRAKCCSRQWQ